MQNANKRDDSDVTGNATTPKTPKDDGRRNKLHSPINFKLSVTVEFDGLQQAKCDTVDLMELGSFVANRNLKELIPLPKFRRIAPN